MTIAEIKASDKVYLSPKEVASVIKIDPAYIRLMAHEAPEKLPFETQVFKTRTKIPRKKFLEYLGEAC